MKLPGRAKAVIATSFAGGLITLAVAVHSLLTNPLPGAHQLVVFATLSAFVAVTWIWPLFMYRGTQSEAVNLDEGLFIIAALLLPLSGAILMFGLAGALAQAARHTRPVKSIFNWGQVVTAAGLGVLVTRVLAAPTAQLTPAQLAAAAAGAVVFSVVNSCAMASIVASLGTPWRTAIRDGMEIRLRLVGSCIAVALTISLAVSAYRWSLPLAVLPIIVLRQVLAGHFQARHDRARLLGLFDAALEANRSLGEGDVLGAILQSARDLLRCPDAAVTAIPPGPSQLGATMLVSGETSWLVVSGRSRTEPFDAADAALLEALAAVGGGALTNGRHYREGRFQRERLAAITSSLGEGVCALDQSAQVTFVNPAAARMLGWDAPSGSVAGRSGTDQAEGPPTPDFLLGPAQRVIQSRETVRGDDTEFRREDGTSLPVAFTASAILDDDQVAGAVIVFRDISERREVEKAIRVARDQAIEASRLKSQFLANMSHEIRTPMNGVLGMSRMLLDTEVDEAQRKYLLAIRDSGESLMVVINDILDFSKIEAGKLDLEDVEFDLSASLASVTNAMTVPAHDRGLVLHLNVDPELPQRVRGDPVRLRQVLSNLVGNAIKFTPSGMVTINAGPRGDGRVRISVTDTGIGIDPAVRATVLDAFGQADSSTTRRYGGTGLGLAICSQLVGMMGGFLDFSSQPGKGSTFWFELPFAQAEAAAAEAAASSEMGASVATPAPQAPAARRMVAPQEPQALAARRTSAPQAPQAPRALQALQALGTAMADPVELDTPSGGRVAQPRVLLADDAPVNQLVASLHLERLGYQVDVVSTGEEAVRAVQETHYDAVLMDCRMPLMDGYQATRLIRQLDGPARGVPIIAMTASAMVGDREECLEAGMDDYLTKPLDRNLLAVALARAARAGQACRSG